MFVIIYGLKGIVYFELRLWGLSQDLYLGIFGGGVINFLNMLSKMFVVLMDGEGCIVIFGFYDDVVLLVVCE